MKKIKYKYLYMSKVQDNKYNISLGLTIHVNAICSQLLFEARN